MGNTIFYRIGKYKQHILYDIMSLGHAYIQNNAHFASSSMPHFTLQPVHAQTSFVLLMSQCIRKYIKYIVYIISIMVINAFNYDF